MPQGSSPPRHRPPDALELAGHLRRDARARRLRVPVHPGELAVAEGLAREDGLAIRVEERVEAHLDVIAGRPRAPPAGPFVPVAGEPTRADDAARLQTLPEQEHPVALSRLPAAGHAPVGVERSAPAQARDVAAQ